jgi:16S rRNA (uracil1498-N3)-methyltransferase
MTRRRWIADEVAGNRAALTGEQAAHLARVLRAHIGQEFEISGGDQVRLGRITSVSDNRVEFDLGEEVGEIAQPATQPVVVLISIFKFDRMEWAIEKLTELGVARIVPVAARRSDAHLVAAAQRRVQRWQRIALQASQQSRRASPPEIVAPQSLREAIQADVAIRIVLAEMERGIMLREALEAAAAEGAIALALGPEGGWTNEELAEFEKYGWRTASLGPNILRAETAAIAAVAICSGIFSYRGPSLRSR